MEKNSDQKQLEKDIRFLRIAREVAKSSKCMSRKIGSVLVKNGSIVSEGYNGPARGVKHCNERDIAFFAILDRKIIDRKVFKENVPIDRCPRRIFDYQSGQGSHLCQAVHSERNAILQAARNGISTLDTTLYLYCEGVSLPCKDCCIELINAGVKEIVCLEGKLYDKYAQTILEEANIIVRMINKELLE